MIDPAFAEVFSFTKNKTYPICIEKEYLKKGDKVLFIDDFLANGEAFKGTENLIAQAQAEIVGVGMVIEKAFQKGMHILSKRDMTFWRWHLLQVLKTRKLHGLMNNQSFF